MAERYRNYGIDLLRMLTMLMIVIMHVLGNGGILASEKLSGINCEVAWFLEIASYCAVNCYAMVTGYVYVNARYRYSRIFELWLQVVFYSVLIYLVVIMFIPGEFDIFIFLQSFLPAMFSQYWYFTAYFCIFFFIPLFNHILNTVPKNALKTAIFSAVIIFSILPCVFGKDIFLTNMGYSPLWCAILYIIGGYIKKYGVLKNKRKLIVTGIYFACVIATGVLKMIAEITNADKFGERFISYTSPFILLSAVALVVVFSSLSLPKVVKKLILILSPCAFGVYLIHVHPMIFKYVLTEDLFAKFAEYPAVGLFFAVIGTSLGIYFACTFIDMMRFLLFKHIRVRKFVLWFEKKFLLASGWAMGVCEKALR